MQQLFSAGIYIYGWNYDPGLVMISQHAITSGKTALFMTRRR